MAGSLNLSRRTGFAELLSGFSGVYVELMGGLSFLDGSITTLVCMMSFGLYSALNQVNKA